jgi:phytoene synthase
MGRLYLPAEDLARFGLRRADVERAAMEARMTPALRELVRFEVRRARGYLDQAAEWPRLVHPSMREMPRQYVALAYGAVERIARDDFDIFHPSRRRRLAGALHGAVAVGAARVRAQATWLWHRPPRLSHSGGPSSGPSRA